MSVGLQERHSPHQALPTHNKAHLPTTGPAHLHQSPPNHDRPCPLTSGPAHSQQGLPTRHPPRPRAGVAEEGPGLLSPRRLPMNTSSSWKLPGSSTCKAGATRPSHWSPSTTDHSTFPTHFLYFPHPPGMPSLWPARSPRPHTWGTSCSRTWRPSSCSASCTTVSTVLCIVTSTDTQASPTLQGQAPKLQPQPLHPLPLSPAGPSSHSSQPE